MLALAQVSNQRSNAGVAKINRHAARPDGKPVRNDHVSHAAFIAEIKKKFTTNQVHVDIFDRHRVTFDGKSHQLVQVAVYREGRPDDALGFDGTGTLQRHLVKPVHEASLTYEPSEGVIEVVANDKDSRRWRQSDRRPATSTQAYRPP